MKTCLSAIGLAIVAQTALLTGSVAFAQNTVTPQDQLGAREDRSLARQVLDWSQDRLAELDATVAVLEKQSAELSGEARAKADETLTALRGQRDAFRIQAEETAANAKTWTNAQLTTARNSLDENWTAFQAAKDEYLENTKADITTRRAILEAELEARQQAWQRSIDELSAEAQNVAADQRTKIDARIAVLKADAAKARDDARVRIERLKDGSAEAWETTKKGYADARNLFWESYSSIRQSIENATK